MIAQTGIVLFGVAAIWLSQDPRPSVARYGCLAGLAAQPFWFIETASAGQWGIFAVSILYTAGWLRGVRTHWGKPAP